MANRHLDRVMSSNYLDGLADWSMEEIRAHRAECQRLEDAASYLRRLVQTRIDIIGIEISQRAAGEDGQVESILEQLPGILVDSGERQQGGRLLNTDPGDDQESWAEARVAEVCGLRDIEQAPELPVEKLQEMGENLAKLERKVSIERRRLHDVFDVLQAEIVRRYKTGLATVDGLLK